MKNSLFAAAAFAVALAGCSNPVASATHSVVLNVETLQAPATISTATPLDLALTVLRGACQTFDRIDAQRSGSDLKLTVLGNDPEKGCTDLGVQEPHSYRVAPPFAPGTFTIIVNRGGLSPLITTVQVK